VEQRTLGRTGLAVSRLGLGLAAIGRPGYITLGRRRDLGGERTPEALYARCAEVLDAAHAAGVRYLDAHGARPGRDPGRRRQLKRRHWHDAVGDKQLPRHAGRKRESAGLGAPGTLPAQLPE
jgi:hypothetical protein